MEIPISAEFVDPLAAAYYSDLITWGFIGARTCSSQPHRQLASSFDFPIGFKNSLDGCVEHAIHGVISCRHPQSFLNINDDGKICAYQSPGNAYGHIVLRGSTTQTNFDTHSVNKALQKLHLAHLPPRLIIDCAHGNCQKQHGNQIDAFNSIVEQIASGNSSIMGLMLESHLQSGSQPLTPPLKYAVSITDPCIDWETTEKLVYSASLEFSST